MTNKKIEIIGVDEREVGEDLMNHILRESMIREANINFLKRMGIKSSDEMESLTPERRDELSKEWKESPERFMCERDAEQLTVH